MLEDFRAQATSITRAPGSNIDLLISPSGQDIPVCYITHLTALSINGRPFSLSYEAVPIVSLAVHHLNTGNGVIVPEIAGLTDKCPMRFTAETSDDLFDVAESLKHVVEQDGRRIDGLKPRPCAFIGSFSSGISVPTSVVTGVLGYPQISYTSTSSELDNRGSHPLFGRTVPSDMANAVPVVQ